MGGSSHTGDKIFFRVHLFIHLSIYSAHAAFGDVFSVIGVREPQPAASEAFVKFADAHRSIEKFGIHLLKTIKPVKNLTKGVKGLEKRGI